jgi:hypothetical protein
MKKGITALMQSKTDKEYEEAIKSIDDPIDMLKAVQWLDGFANRDNYYKWTTSLIEKQMEKVINLNEYR